MPKVQAFVLAFANNRDSLIVFGVLFENRRRTIAARIVNDNELVVGERLIQHAINTRMQIALAVETDMQIEKRGTVRSFRMINGRLSLRSRNTIISASAARQLILHEAQGLGHKLTNTPSSRSSNLVQSRNSLIPFARKPAEEASELAQVAN